MMDFALVFIMETAFDVGLVILFDVLFIYIFKDYISKYTKKMHGIVFTNTEYTSKLEGDWIHIYDYKQVLNVLRYDPRVKYMLIDSDLTDQYNELYHLIQYRCRLKGEQYIMCLYEVINNNSKYNLFGNRSYYIS